MPPGMSDNEIVCGSCVSPTIESYACGCAPAARPCPGLAGDLGAIDYVLEELGAAAPRLEAGGGACAPGLRHWGTPSVIIRS